MKECGKQKVSYKVKYQMGQYTSFSVDKWVGDILSMMWSDTIHKRIRNALFKAGQKYPELSQRAQRDILREHLEIIASRFWRENHAIDIPAELFDIVRKTK